MRCDYSCSSLRKQPERKSPSLGSTIWMPMSCLQLSELPRRRPQETRFSPATSDWRRSALSSNTSASDSRIDWGRLRKWPAFRESVLNLRRRSFSNAMRSKSTLALLPVEGRHALRDRTLLVFLYNTGARVQEASDLRVSDVHFDPTPRVHLHGKGDKWRVCPLWAETATLLKKLVSEQVPDGRARPARLCRREGSRPDPVRDLQDHPAVYHARCQATDRTAGRKPYHPTSGATALPSIFWRPASK